MEEMDADLPSAKLVSQPSAKPHLHDPSGQHVAPDSPSHHRASVPPARRCAHVPAPLPARDTTAGKMEAARHIAGVKPRNQHPRSVCMLVASKCLSPSSATGTAAVAHTAQSNAVHDTNTPVPFSEASGHRS